MKRNKSLSPLLALVLCFSLALPALAADRASEKVVVKGCFQITMDSFLRQETKVYYYDGYDSEGTVGVQQDEFTFYVVEDDSTVTVEAAPGYRYAEDITGHPREPNTVAYAPSSYTWVETNQVLSGGGFGHLASLTGPEVFHVAPSRSEYVSFSPCFSIIWICESDLVRLDFPSYRGDANADPWAKYDMERSFDLGLFPEGLDPSKEDCTREMERRELDEAVEKLYQVLGETADKRSQGIGLPSADGPFTREQAAMALARIYTDLGYDVPQTETTHFDDDQISAEARSAVDFLWSRGVINGVDYWTFAPKRPLTLQEGMALVKRTLDDICFDRYWNDR